MSYNKLVRDNIVNIIKENGETPKFHILNDYELLIGLINKIIEEANEVLLAKNNTELTMELADLLEVLSSIYKLKNINIPLNKDLNIYPDLQDLIKRVKSSSDELVNKKDISINSLNEFITYILSFGHIYNIDINSIFKVMKQKKLEKGGFEKGIFLENVEKIRK